LQTTLAGNVEKNIARSAIRRTFGQLVRRRSSDGSDSWTQTRADRRHQEIVAGLVWCGVVFAFVFLLLFGVVLFCLLIRRTFDWSLLMTKVETTVARPNRGW
jgi:hypothetical protein